MRFLYFAKKKGNFIVSPFFFFRIICFADPTFVRFYALFLDSPPEEL